MCEGWEFVACLQFCWYLELCKLCFSLFRCVLRLCLLQWSLPAQDPTTRFGNTQMRLCHETKRKEKNDTKENNIKWERNRSEKEKTKKKTKNERWFVLFFFRWNTLKTALDGAHVGKLLSHQTKQCENSDFRVDERSSSLCLDFSARFAPPHGRTRMVKKENTKKNLFLIVFCFIF